MPQFLLDIDVFLSTVIFSDCGKASSFPYLHLSNPCITGIRYREPHNYSIRSSDDD